jgi:hypothetical protein
MTQGQLTGYPLSMQSGSAAADLYHAAWWSV